MIVRRGHLSDHYVEDERSVVMVDESVLGLSPIATTILEAVPPSASADLAAITEHVVATFGPPESSLSAEDITRQQVWDLVAHKVLVVVEGEALSGGTATLTGPREGDPSVAERNAAVTALRSALRHLRSDAQKPWVAPDTVTPTAFVTAARQHHVIPYLAAHLDRLDLPAQAVSELNAMAGRQRAGATLLAADLSLATEALRASGVRALAFKGVALAAQAYGDFTIRGAGDIDLLVAPEDLAAAHEALTEAGWRPAHGFPTPGASWGWRHFVRTGSELTFVGAHSEIDLHWFLVPTRGTFPDFNTLWSRHAVVRVADHAIPTLAPYDALTHSAGHAAKDRWRWLRSLLDVHALMSNHDTWRGADRPLRRDQRVSIGLAALELGEPAGAPPVVASAARGVVGTLVERAHVEQAETALEHRSHTVPGGNFVLELRVASRTGKSLREVARLLSRSVWPPWLTREEASSHAWVAAPRVLTRRTAGAVRRVAASRRR